MPGQLFHLPSEVVRKLLIDQGASLVTDGASWTTTLKPDWPVYRKPTDRPDNQVAVQDTTPRIQGHDHVAGETAEEYGVQIMVRSADDTVAFAKINAIVVFLDAVQRSFVDVTSSNPSKSYIVNAATRMSGPIPAGSDVPGGKRQVYTVNYLVSIRECS